MKKFTVLALVLFSSLLLSACGSKQTAPVSNRNTAIAVETVTVTKTDFSKSYNTSGQIKAAAEATIASKVSGRVSEVYAKLGDQVVKGQVLFRLESKEAHDQLIQSQANLGISQASYDTAVQALKDAQSSYDRTSTLYESGAVSKTSLEDMTTKLVNAQLSVQKARQELDKLDAAISIAQDNVSNYSVIAPISGLIGSFEVEIGEMVNSQTNAAVIVSIDTVKVKATVPESVVNTISVGSKVPVKVEALDKSVEGTVTAIAPKMESTTMGYPVEVSITNPTGEIKPGMTAVINLATGVLSNVITVPMDAVIEKDGQHIVYLMENDKAKEVYVQTGFANESQVEITSGLEEGQSLVVQGNRLISDGQPVRLAAKQAGEAR